MKIKSLSMILPLILLVTSHASHASIINFTWNSTLEASFANVGSTVGESVTVTIAVDNGGTDIASQSWNINDFVSYSISGDSGWWMTAVGIVDINSSNSYWTTDNLGNVTSAGNWKSYFSDMTSSWGASTSNNWWNNGQNYVESFGGIDLANIVDITNATSWVAAPLPVDPTDVPEPGSLALLALGFAAVRFSSKKKAI